MKTINVVCPYCKSNDIEWVSDPRFNNSWFCYGCGRYFGTPMLAPSVAPSSKKQLQHR